MGVSENRGPYYRTPNSRILIIRIPKYGTPNFRKLPYRAGSKKSQPLLAVRFSRLAQCHALGIFGPLISASTAMIDSRIVVLH